MSALDPFYLVTGEVSRLEPLLPCGVKFVQLRLKDKADEELRRQIALARDLCRSWGAQLVVNDYWQIALDLGCDYIHLGQEDMETADFKALRRHRIRYGLSTHDEAELENALAHDPDYVALGPVYPTQLKKMKWAPQGLERLRSWKQKIGDLPLVAIGGLTPERLPAVFEAGADSAAVVTDIQTAQDPVARCRLWIQATEAWRE